jgi:hypothetical protein
MIVVRSIFERNIKVLLREAESELENNGEIRRNFFNSLLKEKYCIRTKN